MTWTFDDLPISFNDLNPRIREKVVEIANQLEKQEVNRNEILPLAIKQAEEWFLDLEG